MNTIALAKNYVNLLDEVYRDASVTEDLTSDAAMMRAGANADEIIYPQASVSGLGNYDRNSGYTNATVNVVWRTARFNYDRGTRISVDVMDDQESFNVALGVAGAALQRERVAPEADAFTFATLAGTPNISIGPVTTFADGVQFLAGLLAAKNVMDEQEVPEEGRILYATPTLLNLVMALETTRSREVLHSFSRIVRVPQARFFTAINLLDGRSAGQQLGHYVKTPLTGRDINYMIVHKPAVIKFDKHVVSDIIRPGANPTSDAHIAKYRKYGIVDVYNNKRAGIFLSHRAT